MDKLLVLHHAQILSTRDVFKTNCIENCHAALSHLKVEVCVGKAEDRLRHAKLHEHRVDTDGVRLSKQPIKERVQRVVKSVVALSEEELAVDANGECVRYE